MQSSKYQQYVQKFKWQRHWKETLRQKNRVQQAKDIVESIMKTRSSSEADNFGITIARTSLNERYIEKEKQLFRIHLLRLSRKQREYLLELSALQQDEENADITSSLMEEFLQHFFPSIYTDSNNDYFKEFKTDLMSFAYQIHRELCTLDDHSMMQELLFLENMNRRAEILHLLLELNTKMNQFIKQYNVYSITANPYIDDVLECIAEKEIWYPVASKIQVKKPDTKSKKLSKKTGIANLPNISSATTISTTKKISPRSRKAPLLSQVKQINYQMIPSKTPKKPKLEKATKLVYIPPCTVQQESKNQSLLDIDSKQIPGFCYNKPQMCLKHNKQDAVCTITDMTTVDSCTAKSWSPSVLNQWSPTITDVSQEDCQPKSTSMLNSKRSSSILCGAMTPKKVIKVPRLSSLVQEPVLSLKQELAPSSNKVTASMSDRHRFVLQNYNSTYGGGAIKPITPITHKAVPSNSQEHLPTGPISRKTDIPKYYLQTIPEYKFNLIPTDKLELAEKRIGRDIVSHKKKNSQINSMPQKVHYTYVEDIKYGYPVKATSNMHATPRDATETARVTVDKEVYLKSQEKSFWTSLGSFFSNNQPSRPKPLGRNKSRFYCTN